MKKIRNYVEPKSSTEISWQVLAVWEFKHLERYGVTADSLEAVGETFIPKHEHKGETTNLLVRNWTAF